MRTRITLLLTLAVTLLLAGSLATQGSTAEHQPRCMREASIDVPRAERQQTSCLQDLTTAGTIASGHTEPADWAGLSSVRTVNPTGVRGIQVDGYFPDTSATNTHHGWDHDAQFVIRLPDDWNGKLVVTGAPGNRRQYALDATISDWVLARGYAFASTDKGNTGTEFYRDGRRPGDAIAEWHRRVTQLTVAAKEVARQRYGMPPRRTYVTGISNGGYLTRWQLENRPGLYDGGVDWEGSLFQPDGPNVLTYLPKALTHYPRYRAGSEEAHQAMLEAGFAAGSEFLWEYHYAVYWGLTQEVYRKELDPTYEGAEADYDYFARPASVRRAVQRIALTGQLGKPMLTLHGTIDALLPPATDSDVDADLVADSGRGAMHRYYRIEDGNHVDGLVDAYPDRLRAMLPCHRDAFTVLESWVERGEQPPSSGLVPNPGGDTVNSCSVAAR